MLQGHSAFAAEEFKASSTVGQVDEVLYGKLFRPFVEDRVGTERISFLRIGDMELRSVLRRWLNVVLTICLNNCSLHPNSFGLVAGHADDGAFHLGRRIEYMFVYGEQVFHAVQA